MCCTGYKLRQHISKALKTRSQAVKTALQQFNNAARKLDPPRESLRWDQVVEYTFLSEFDILSETRDDIRQKPWARPAARTLMDQFFGMERAKEELDHLNVEIPRLTTFIQDEEDFLHKAEHELKTKDPAIAYQISLRRRHFELANQEHLFRLQKLGKMVGFTGSLGTGQAVEHISGTWKSQIQQGGDIQKIGPTVLEQLDEETAFALEEEEADKREEELGKDLETVMGILDLETE